jgi:hypothetical protein
MKRERGDARRRGRALLAGVAECGIGCGACTSLDVTDAAKRRPPSRAKMAPLAAAAGLGVYGQADAIDASLAGEHAT